MLWHVHAFSCLQTGGLPPENAIGPTGNLVLLLELVDLTLLVAYGAVPLSDLSRIVLPLLLRALKTAPNMHNEAFQPPKPHVHPRQCNPLKMNSAPTLFSCVILSSFFRACRSLEPK